jgi:hypothetical protein
MMFSSDAVSVDMFRPLWSCCDAARSQGLILILQCTR